MKIAAKAMHEHGARVDTSNLRAQLCAIDFDGRHAPVGSKSSQ
jgi:hypothetical protein